MKKNWLFFENFAVYCIAVLSVLVIGNYIFNKSANAQFEGGAFGSNRPVYEYLQASITTNHANLSTGNNVKFDTTDRSNGSSISHNTTTGVFTLSPGKTYKLSGAIMFEHTSAAYIGFAWYNITGTSQISETALLRNASSSGDYSTNSGMQTIITPTVTTQVSIRCVTDGDGVEDVNGGYSWVIIEVK